MTVFVLSETEFYEFEVLWENWIPPFDPGPDINSDAEAIQVDADLPDMRGSEEIKRTLDRSGKLEFQTQSQEYITEDAADNGTVEDAGPNAEIKKQTSRYTCWDGVLEADLEKITEDRDEAGDQSTAQFDKMHSPDGQSLSASDRPGMAEQAMRAAKAKIFTTVFKANISKLAHVEFDPGQEPVLRLKFETHEEFEVIVIKFMDDVARERWRCGLAYVLNKADTAAQWHRGWEREDAKEPADL